MDDELPQECMVCRERVTEDAYELEPGELERLARLHRVWGARRHQQRYGAVPICRECFDRIGFDLEGGRPGDPAPLVQLGRRPRRDGEA